MLAKIRNTFTYKYLVFCGITTILTLLFIALPSSGWDAIGAWIFQVGLVGITALITIIPIIIDIVRRKRLKERKSNGVLITIIEFIAILAFLLQACFVFYIIAPEVLEHLSF